MQPLSSFHLLFSLLALFFSIAHIYIYAYYIYTYAFIVGPHRYTLSSMTAFIFAYYFHCHILSKSQVTSWHKVGTNYVFFDGLLWATYNARGYKILQEQPCPPVTLGFVGEFSNC